MKRFFKTAAFALSAVILCAAAQAEIRVAIEAPKDRSPAPTFRLAAASGKLVPLSSYRGSVVLLNFWATACGGCKVEIPYFVDIDHAFRSKGLTVLGVSMDVLYEDLKTAKEGWARVKPFIQTHNIKYPILMGDNGVSNAWKLDAYPATYLIDRKGRIAATYIGIVDKADVEANIETLLKER